MIIKLELAQDATRAQLLDQLLAFMTPDQRTQFDYILNHTVIPDKHHHTIAEVNESIDGMTVEDALKENMRAVYAILAHAEAKVHGCTVEDTHFHEVGNASGIRNALAICTAFYVLSPDNIEATSVQTGYGKVKCAHGLMDIPTPATKVILKGIPLANPLLEGELCTPTSAAIIKHYVQEFVD